MKNQILNNYDLLSEGEYHDFFEIVYIDDEFIIYACPNWKYNIPYFQFYRKNKINSYCRISMENPIYLEKSKENILTKNELNKLINILNTQVKDSRYIKKSFLGSNSWEYIQYILNDIYESSGSKVYLENKLDIPDYTLLPTID